MLEERHFRNGLAAKLLDPAVGMVLPHLVLRYTPVVDGAELCADAVIELQAPLTKVGCIRQGGSTGGGTRRSTGTEEQKARQAGRQEGIA